MIAKAVAVSALVCFVALAAPVAAPGKTLRNGGFEQPETTSTTSFSTGATFPGWNVVGVIGQVTIVNEDYESSGIAFPAHTGSQFLDLTGPYSTNTGRVGVEKIARTRKGARYRLGFAVGNATAAGCGATTKVDVYVRGRKVMTATNRRGTNKLIWQKFSARFRARGGDTRIRFVNADPTDDTCSGLDSITLKRL